MLALAAPGSAYGKPDPGLCNLSQARGAIPTSFAVDACFDGSALVLHNNLDVAMGVATSGDVSGPKRSTANYDLAALATRAVSSDQTLLLPGDELRFRVGPGAARIKLRGTRKGGFFMLASAADNFIPGKTTGLVKAFTAMVKEVDDDLRQFQTCRTSKSRLHRAGCHALLVRNIGVAGSRFVFHGALSVARKNWTKLLGVLVDSVTFARWLNAQPGQLAALIHSPAITFGAVPPPATTPPFTECPAIGVDTSCGIIVVVDAAGHQTFTTDPSQGPYDGDDDTLIGVVNHAATPLRSLRLTGPGIFDFDGDGLCAGDDAPLGCPFGTSGYEGPGTQLAADSGTTDAGTVTFAGAGLAPNTSTYFSLEGPATSLVAQAPSAVTGAAASIGQTEATLNGTVDPNGADAEYHFEYGTDTSYGDETDAGSVSADPSDVPGSAVHPVSASVDSLSAGTTYHYRLVASNAVGTTYGADQTFTTAAPPHRVNAYDNYGSANAGHAMCRGNPGNSASMPGGTVNETFTVPAGVASIGHAQVQIDPDATVTGHASLLVNGTTQATADAAAAGDTQFSFSAVSVAPGDSVTLRISFTATSGKIITVYTAGSPGGSYSTSNSCPAGADNSSSGATGLRAVVSGWSG